MALFQADTEIANYKYKIFSLIFAKLIVVFEYSDEMDLWRLTFQAKRPKLFFNNK